MKLCGKLVPNAKNGTPRGRCSRFHPHMGNHATPTCPDCGIKLALDNAPPKIVSAGTGKCTLCRSHRHRQLHGIQPRTLQVPKTFHSFPCGCCGELPEQGKSNHFAVFTTHEGRKYSPGFVCRISRILMGIKSAAKRGKYAPIPPNISHSILRNLQSDRDCILCKTRLGQQLGRGKTPHLHHNHESGEPIGFAHPKCNLADVQTEINRLKALLKKNGIAH